jgi:lipopolysaccharide transport system ATP-binding protein
MYVRLAFAVAAHLEPEILIVDEVLAVGDAEFQKKCLGKMKDVAGHGRTILFVSHNMAAIQHLCSRAIVLQNGQLTLDSNTDKAVESYLLEMSSPDSAGMQIKSFDGTFSITHTILRDLNGAAASSFKPGDEMTVEIHYEAQSPIELPYFWLGISNNHGGLLTANMLLDGFRPRKLLGKGFIRCRFPSLQLFPQNAYFVRAGMRYQDSTTLVFPSSDMAFFNVTGAADESGYPSPVADQHLSGSGGVPCAYEWELSDGSRHFYEPAFGSTYSKYAQSSQV